MSETKHSAPQTRLRVWMERDYNSWLGRLKGTLHTHTWWPLPLKEQKAYFLWDTLKGLLVVLTRIAATGIHSIRRYNSQTVVDKMGIKNVTLLALFLTVLRSWECQLIPDSFQQWTQELSLETGMEVRWNSEDRYYLTMEISAPTAGYVAIGFSPSGGMKGSDIVLGWVDRDGIPYLVVRTFIGIRNHLFLERILKSGGIEFDSSRISMLQSASNQYKMINRITT